MDFKKSTRVITRFFLFTPFYQKKSLSTSLCFAGDCLFNSLFPTSFFTVVSFSYVGENVLLNIQNRETIIGLWNDYVPVLFFLEIWLYLCIANMVKN